MKKKRTNPYKEANEAFLAVKAQEEGIVALDNGVLYKVLEEGHGPFHAHFRTPISQDRTLSSVFNG